MICKVNTLLIFLFGFSLGLFGVLNSPVSAAAGTLTNKQALQAVKQELHCFGSCKMSVIGVWERPQQNMAEADIKVSNITFKMPKRDAVTAFALGRGPRYRVWSGQIAAIFIHFNNGKWVLRKIITSNPPIGNWDNLNIVVNP